MNKKIFALLLILALVVSMSIGLTACKDEEDEFKIGFILLHDEDSTYDKNFLDAALEVQAKLGLKDSQVIFKKNVDESNACYEAAVDLVEQGCDIIFADSFGHEDHMIKAAKEFSNVQFCHATGTKAHTENLANYHNAFASIYEGRYLAGIAAGMKLNSMAVAAETAVDGKATGANAKMGYVGAFTYAEVISGYTSFYLGAKSVCPEVKMDVKFTGSWYDPAAEKEAAEALIQGGCKLISQHADSMGAPTACETAGVPNVSYNGSTKASCPNTFIVSSRINWAPYYEYIIDCVQNSKTIATDWCGGIAEGSVVLTEVNATAAAAGTQAAVDAAKAKFVAGTLNVFDTNTFTVTVVKEGEQKVNVNATVDANGKLTGYMADVNSDAAFTADTEVVKDGAFAESKFRSAPYFDMTIDGITLLNAKF